MYTHFTNHHIISLMSFWLPMHRVSLVVCFDRSNELSVGFRAALLIFLLAIASLYTGLSTLDIAWIVQQRLLRLICREGMH